jgi:putative salt-induced outer membrane protein YdiY
MALPFTTKPRMKPNIRYALLRLALLIWGGVLTGRADILIGTNGERFAGKVVEETADAVVFDSEIAGRLKIPRSRILEIQRTASPAASQQSGVTNQPSTISVPTNNVGASTNLDWRPPAVGLDGSDWIQLKSGEWLRGHLKYIQQKKVEFDSDELKDQSLDLKDVRQVYSANPQFTKFNGRDQIYGTVVLSNNVVQVVGPEQVSLPRDQLTGITPGGKREIDFWSGNLNIGLSLQSGNTRQVTLSTSAELARRTPATVVRLNYLGNYAEAEGVQNANNQRITFSYDIRLNPHWFVRPAYLEYYQDQLANIAHQGTFGVELGYYIFDRQGLEWNVSGGPGYQRTKYETVEPGQADTASTPAGVLHTYFKADITRRLKFTETIGIALTSEKAGLYSHHAVSTLEFEIKRHLDLDVSFVWDYLQNPQTESSGVLPLRSDFRFNVGVGVKF